MVLSQIACEALEGFVSGELSATEAFFLVALIELQYSQNQASNYAKMEEKDPGEYTNEDGWFRCTAKDMNELGWSNPQQDRLFRSLENKSYVRIKRVGLPGKRWTALFNKKPERRKARRHGRQRV